jgi:phage/plasmid-associated DNA primase
LTEIASESFRFGGTSLVGKTLCWFDEVEVTRNNMGNSLINLITGQHIHVERKGINGIVEADNKLKCVLTANTLPRSAEMGIYRRMILIYLNYSFYDNMTDNKNIRQLLRAEASGVLNRMLRGLKDIEANDGFTTIEGHDDLIEDYKTSSNTVAEFLDEHFDFDYDAPKIGTKVLLEAYKNYSDDKYSSSLTPQRFGTLLSSHGLSKFDKIQQTRLTGGTRAWAGLRLKEAYELNAGFIREKKEF